MGGLEGKNTHLWGIVRVQTGERKYKIYNNNAISICCGFRGKHNSVDFVPIAKAVMHAMSPQTLP